MCVSFATSWHARNFPLFLHVGMKVRIEPSTSLFKISRPASDTVVRKVDERCQSANATSSIDTFILVFHHSVSSHSAADAVLHTSPSRHSTCVSHGTTAAALCVLSFETATDGASVRIYSYVPGTHALPQNQYTESAQQQQNNCRILESCSKLLPSFQ